MRTFLFIVVYFSFFACKSGQQTNVSEKPQSHHCPNDGVCSFEVLKNKSVVLKYDSTGQLYPEINDSKKIVIKFEYKRNEIPNTQDGNYREIVYFEIDPINPEVNFEDSELKTTNALFARLCFCRGQTGYYNIKNGKLSIKKINESNYGLEFDFKIEEVPQVIKSISENIQI